MTDYAAGVRQVIQDLVAPDLKAISARQEALHEQIATMQKQMEVQHYATVKTIVAFRAEMRSEFAALRANNQLEVLRQVAPISERLAVVEKKA